MKQELINFCDEQLCKCNTNAIEVGENSALIDTGKVIELKYMKAKIESMPEPVDSGIELLKRINMFLFLYSTNESTEENEYLKIETYVIDTFFSKLRRELTNPN